MSIVLAEIPNQHPLVESLDFSAAKMTALFDYGKRCAFAGELWSDPINALDKSASGPPPSAGIRSSGSANAPTSVLASMPGSALSCPAVSGKLSPGLDGH
jgi:hypothetical protein